MGAIGKPHSVKLFCGIISSGKDVEDKAFCALKEKFGEIDFTSEIMKFDYTSYYEPEMGPGLARFWISFKKLISAADLAKIKVFTNSVEDGLAKDGKRPINIDPGYITPASVILATTKNYSHRIYLSDGIYGEITTMYKKSGFVKLPWSYPDYLSKISTDFLSLARADLLKQLKEER